MTGSEQQIRRIRRAVEDAANAGDADALAELLADDVVMAPSGGHLRGRDEVVDHHRKLWDDFDLEERFSIGTVVVCGDLATEHGTYTATATPRDSGAPSRVEGRYLYVYTAHPGNEWKIQYMSWEGSST